MSVKNAVYGLLKAKNLEIARLGDWERRESVAMGLDPSKQDYKDVQVARGIAAAGHISLDEARFLGELVRSTGPDEPIIEIGTLFGFSTLVIAMNKHPKQRLITVDNYSWNPLGISPDAHRAATRSVLGDAVAHHGVELVDMDKDAFFGGYDGPPPGLFFCDADHSYEATRKDLLWARSQGARIICGHDFHPTLHQGVTRAVSELGGPSKLVGCLFVL